LLNGLLNWKSRYNFVHLLKTANFYVMKKQKKNSKREVLGKSFSTTRAGLAFKHGFYLETAWILSLLCEKKARNLLKKIEQGHTVQGYSFEQSIKRIKYHHQSGRIPSLVKHMETGLIDEMREWKNFRNAILRDMVNVHISPKRLERLASEGITIYKKWNMSLKRIKNEL